MTAKEAAEAKRREKAKNLRYKKPVLKDLNADSIREQVSDMYEACADVAYFIQQDDNDLLYNALDGDSDDVEAFRTQFMLLQNELEMLDEDLGEMYNYALEEDDFNLFFAAVGAHEGDMLGYDEFEGDYYGLNSSFETEAAQREATKKLERLTKADLIDRAQLCFKIAFSFIALRNRYQDLEAALDILRAQNSGLTGQVRSIEAAYEKAAEADFYEWRQECKEFYKLISQLPDRIWIE